MSRLKPPRAIATCSGKRSLYVSKKLAFEKALTQCSAVDFDKRAVVPIAELVNSIGNQFLPSSGFTQQ